MNGALPVQCVISLQICILPVSGIILRECGSIAKCLMSLHVSRRDSQIYDFKHNNTFEYSQ